MAELVNLPLTPDKKKELCSYLHKIFDYSLNARSQQIDRKFTNWMKNYAGEPKEKVRTTPWPNASNFMPQLIRMHTDIMTARVIGFIFGTKPFWMPKTFLPGIPHEQMDALGQWLEYESFYNIKLEQPLDSAFLRAFKTGTCTLKAPWLKQEVWLGSPGTNGNESYTEVALREEGIQVQPIPFNHFFPYPITAESIDKVRIKFHRIPLSADDVKRRQAQKTWDSAACDMLLRQQSRTPEPAADAQAREAGVDLNEFNTDPINVVEAWLDYAIGADITKLYRIVVVFNPADPTEKSYLRGYFNPNSRGLEPFFDLRPNPREDFYYGYSMPEILEGAQEEMSQIHNFRRDANTIANSPGWKKKRDADVPNPSSSWMPGKVWELDSMDDLEPLQFSGGYNSLLEEEQFLIGWVERLTGSGPPTQGMGAGGMEGKRGIYTAQGTMAMLSEGNRRLDVIVKRCRNSFHRLGSLIYTSNRDQRPNGAEFMVYAQKGEAIKRTFDFHEPEGYRGLFFGIGASNASANKEVDRSNLLLMANTMAAYYRQVTEMVGIIGQMPEGHPIRESMLLVLDGARDLSNRLLFAFDIDDRDRLLPDARSVLGGGTPEANAASGAVGLPQAEEPIPSGGLEDLSSMLGAMAGAGVGEA